MVVFQTFEIGLVTSGRDCGKALPADGVNGSIVIETMDKLRYCGKGSHRIR